jgi:hypothetical protein
MIDNRERCYKIGAMVYNNEGEVFCRYIGLLVFWKKNVRGLMKVSGLLKNSKLKKALNKIKHSVRRICGVIGNLS